MSTGTGSSGVVVQKYGGSSLKDLSMIRRAAARVCRRAKSGERLVVVVSAMGDSTNQLMKHAQAVTAGELPSSTREIDNLLATGENASSALMAIAINSLGRKAISLSGSQAGIRTNSEYTSARIASVDASRVINELNKGNIVVVAGFQGFYAKAGDVTTLGRGGSDTTAVSLAIALKASRCEIYTDVEGIYTADPRLEPVAVKLKEVDFQEMLEMAFLGAKMNPRSIELAAVYEMPVYVASSFSEAPGTLIHSLPKRSSLQRKDGMEIRKVVTGIPVDKDIAKISLYGVEDTPGAAAKILSPLATENISVDVIVHAAYGTKGRAVFGFTVSQSDFRKALSIVESRHGEEKVEYKEGLAKVSIVGTGMQNSPGYASLMFDTLGGAGVNIEMISTSEIRITCVISRDDVKTAVSALHKAFEWIAD